MKFHSTAVRSILRNTRRPVIGLAALALAAFTTACGSAGGNASPSPAAPGSSSPTSTGIASASPGIPDKPLKIRLGLDTGGSGALQFRTAQAQGFFKSHGVDAEISNFSFGVDTINALLLQRTDTAMAADYALLNSLGKGDMKIISTLARPNEATTKQIVLVVKGNIAKPEDLRGKKLAVPRGTVYEYVWAKLLQKYQIAEKDVKLVYYSSQDEAIVGLTKGDMDAVWSGGALLEKFLKIDGAKILGDISLSGVNIINYHVVTSDFLKNNQPTMTEYLKAIKEGIDFIPAHKEQTADLAFKELKLPKDSVLKDLDTLNYVLGFTQEDYQHLQDMKTWLEEKGLLKDKYDLKDKISVDALKAAFPESVTYTK